MSMASSVRALHVLVLGGREGAGDLTPWTESAARVDHAETIEEALDALRRESYDLIVSRAADFSAFQQAHSVRYAAAVFDNICQGVCIVGKAGTMDWANPKMLGFPEPVRGEVCRVCRETFASAELQARTGSSDLPSRRVGFTVGPNRRFEMTATPVIDLHHRVVEVAAVVWDATGSDGLREKMDAIERAGAELLSLDAQQFSRLDSHERLALLEQRIVRCTRDLLHFDNFEIRIIDKDTRKLELVMSSGLGADAGSAELYAQAEGNGITGYVAARGRSYICPDARKDPRFLPGIESGLSSLTVPLWLHEKVVGTANFESTRVAAFTEDDRQFAEIFGRYAALALHLLELLASERQTTTGQLGTNVMAEITAPLNDILTDVETLTEDYIGHDDLRHRLRAISENAVRIRETIKELTSTKAGLIGVKAKKVRASDPLLAGKRVLIADDEELLRDTVRDVLTGYGCEVRTAENGAVAIDWIAKERFDLVLSDIKMPNKTGYEVFAAAKEANAHTPVILTTGFGYDPNHSIVRARREGLAAVLFKPFKVDQLLKEIRAALTHMAAE
jgi:CheY-like chemotaxis protein/GAF domain-containing protein